MSARKERKRQRRLAAEREEVRHHYSVRSFRDLAHAVAEERVYSMSDTERRRIESILDDEGAAMFRGIMGLTSKVADRLGREEPARVDPFAAARTILQHVEREEYRAAIDLVLPLADNRDLLSGVRSSLVRAGQGLMTLDADDGSLDLARKASILDVIREKLSDVIAVAAHNLEGMVQEDFDFVEQVEVNLPNEVDRPTHVDSVPLVVLPDGYLRKGVMKAKPLTSGVYLVECTMVGVPSKVSPEDRLLAADAYALATFGATVSDWPLTRPDSDAVWFPMFAESFIVQQAQFPDQARRYYGSTSAMNDTASVQMDAKVAYLRSQKLQFERDNSLLYRELTDARDELEDLKHRLRHNREVYLTKTTHLPSVDFRIVEAMFRDRVDAMVAAAGLDFMARHRALQLGRQEVQRVRSLRDSIIDDQLRVSFLRKRIANLEDAIEEAKRLTLNPHLVHGDAFLQAVGLR